MRYVAIKNNVCDIVTSPSVNKLKEGGRKIRCLMFPAMPRNNHSDLCIKEHYLGLKEGCHSNGAF